MEIWPLYQGRFTGSRAENSYTNSLIRTILTQIKNFNYLFVKKGFYHENFLDFRGFLLYIIFDYYLFREFLQNFVDIEL